MSADVPVKIVSRWTKQWHGASGEYESVLMYEWHWSDGSTSLGHSCPRDEFLHLIERGPEIVNPTRALVNAAFAKLAEEDPLFLNRSRNPEYETEMAK